MPNVSIDSSLIKAMTKGQLIAYTEMGPEFIIPKVNAFKLLDTIHRGQGNWDALTFGQWVAIFNKHPEYTNKCNWIFSGERWSFLLKHHPQFVVHIDMNRLQPLECAKLLADNIDLVSIFPWTKMQPREWVVILQAHPHLYVRDEIQWDQFSPRNWFQLLTVQPDFVARPEFGWSVLNLDPYNVEVDGQRSYLDSWACLLSHQPKFFAHLPDTLDLYECSQSTAYDNSGIVSKLRVIPKGDTELLGPIWMQYTLIPTGSAIGPNMTKKAAPALENFLK